MKRLITLLLTLAMTFSLAMPAQAASTKASTMRLMDTVGTATVENAAGKNLSIKDNMRLYNGYEVATKDASYAYISLDSSKAVKLDASSAVKVNQSGKKLELDVTAGELFFNVPVALKSNESMKIRSSTMVTGIRGTAGWVNALDRYTTRVAVLEGAVTINSQDPFTGADRSVTITGGQIATIIRHERAMAIQQQLIDDGVIIEDNIIAELTKPGQVVEELQESGVPGFVATEVAANEDLQDRMNEESPLDVEEIIKDADQRLNAEEKAAEKQNDLIKKELKELTATNPGLPFATPEVIVQTNTVTNTVTNTETEYVSAVLVNPTNAQVETALNSINTVVIAEGDENFDLTSLKLSEEDTVYVLDGEYVIDENTEWEIDCGTLICAGGVQLINYGSIVTSTGVLKINPGAELINYGEIYILGGDENSNSLVLNSALQNFALLSVGYKDYENNTIHTGKMLIESRGELYNGSTDSNEEARSRVCGEIYIFGEYIPEPAMLAETPEENGTQTVENSILTNAGTIYNYGVFANAGIIENQGTFYNGTESYEELTRQSAPREVTYNYGVINNSGRLLNMAAFYQYDGSITATGTNNHAFELDSGTLYLYGGTISASEDCSALYYNCNSSYSGGYISEGDGKIIHNGGGSGYALEFASWEGATYANSYATVSLIVPADSIRENLMGSNHGNESIYLLGPDVCLNHANTNPVVHTITLANSRWNPLACFPYIYTETANGYAAYVVILDVDCTPALSE